MNHDAYRLLDYARLREVNENLHASLEESEQSAALNRAAATIALDNLEEMTDAYRALLAVSRNLRNYIVGNLLPITDIPDAVWCPFDDALSDDEKKGDLVLVPREPTRAMLKAGSGKWATNDTYGQARCTYRAMLDAYKKSK